VLLWLADEFEVLLRGLPRRLHRLAATGGEEDPVQVAGGEGGDPLDELGLHRGGVAPHRKVRQLGGLLGGDLGHLAAAVSDLDDEQAGQAGQAVEDFPAAVVPNVGTFATGDDRDGRFGVAALPGEVHSEVVGSPGRGRVGDAGRVLLDRGGPRCVSCQVTCGGQVSRGCSTSENGMSGCATRRR
jgi:hypothetical protein